MARVLVETRFGAGESLCRNLPPRIQLCSLVMDSWTHFLCRIVCFVSMENFGKAGAQMIKNPQVDSISIASAIAAILYEESGEFGFLIMMLSRTDAAIQPLY